MINHLHDFTATLAGTGTDRHTKPQKQTDGAANVQKADAVELSDESAAIRAKMQKATEAFEQTTELMDKSSPLRSIFNYIPADMLKKIFDSPDLWPAGNTSQGNTPLGKIDSELLSEVKKERLKLMKETPQENTHTGAEASTEKHKDSYETEA